MVIIFYYEVYKQPIFFGLILDCITFLKYYKKKQRNLLTFSLKHIIF